MSSLACRAVRPAYSFGDLAFAAPRDGPASECFLLCEAPPPDVPAALARSVGITDASKGTCAVRCCEASSCAEFPSSDSSTGVGGESALDVMRPGCATLGDVRMFAGIDLLSPRPVSSAAQAEIPRGAPQHYKGGGKPQERGGAQLGEPAALPFAFCVSLHIITDDVLAVVAVLVALVVLLNGKLVGPQRSVATTTVLMLAVDLNLAQSRRDGVIHALDRVEVQVARHICSATDFRPFVEDIFDARLFE